MLALAVERHEVSLLLRGELRLLAPKPALGLGHGHALASPGADEGGLELGDHREHVEQQPAHRVGRVVHGRAELQADAAAGELVEDVAGVRDGARKPVELRDDQGVALPAGGQRLTQSRPLAVRPPEPVVDVDTVDGDAHARKRLALRGEVLACGASCVADEDAAHALTVPQEAPLRGRSAGGSSGTPAASL